MLAKIDVSIVYSKDGMMIKNRGVYKSQCHNIIVIIIVTCQLIKGMYSIIVAIECCVKSTHFAPN